ncbi:hypothetical protein [Pirellula sp. SH-Sr6A]|uniref:hypothetical protein n=1 Tax=Pirellula sp. SH-Sr6A TaxID=1632865 RepID=UPI0011BA5256|nr:hypothetical protein [Pirellula sp. SH-Sr6A]
MAVWKTGLALALAMWICDLCFLFGLAVLQATSSMRIPVPGWIGLLIVLPVVEICFLIAVVLAGRSCSRKSA